MVFIKSERFYDAEEEELMWINNSDVFFNSILIEPSRETRDVKKFIYWCWQIDENELMN